MTRRGTADDELRVTWGAMLADCVDDPVRFVRDVIGIDGGPDGPRGPNAICQCWPRCTIDPWQAQTMRDLADLATVIYTAPPGAINTSNTASALMVALDSLGTFAVTGVPAPVATALKQASKYMRDQKVKARINQALSAHQKEI